MKHLLTLCFFLFLGANFAKAQTSPEPMPINIVGSNAKITFAKTEHNFGSQPQGKPVKYDFVFTNEGTEPLTLTNVKASCGCTTPSWPKEPIAPGETGKITAEYNMARSGPFNKSITVTTGGGETVILYIKGDAVSTENTNSVDEVKPTLISTPKPE
ncbi:MAG: DUF1573 domain-containing protein [Chitinophagales bacterium]|nr:DUF1573 domain-containing protein [Chitinophagales bacterium]